MPKYNKHSKIRRFVIKDLKLINLEKVNNRFLYLAKNKELFDLHEEHLEEIKAKKKGVEENREGQIYIIGNKKEQVIKIGFSKNPEKRIKELQTGCPYKIKVLLTFPGTIQIEQTLHKKYKRYNLYGEWFKLEGELRKALKL